MESLVGGAVFAVGQLYPDGRQKLAVGVADKPAVVGRAGKRALVRAYQINMLSRSPEKRRVASDNLVAKVSISVSVSGMTLAISSSASIRTP
mgnify:CR=1 FL=1